jgi:hypothetical protein
VVARVGPHDRRAIDIFPIAPVFFPGRATDRRAIVGRMNSVLSIALAAITLTGCGYFDAYTPPAVVGRDFRAIAVSEDGWGPEGWRASRWRIAEMDGGALVHGVQRTRVTVTDDAGATFRASCTHDLRTGPTTLVCLVRTTDQRRFALVMIGEEAEPLRGHLVSVDDLAEIEGLHPDGARFKRKHTPAYVVRADGVTLGAAFAEWPRHVWLPVERESRPPETTVVLGLVLMALGDARDLERDGCPEDTASPGGSIELCLELTGKAPLAVAAGAEIPASLAPYGGFVDRLRDAGQPDHAVALMAHLTAD